MTLQWREFAGDHSYILAWQQMEQNTLNTSVSKSIEVIHLILGSRPCRWLCNLLFPSHCCLVWFHRSRPAPSKASIINRVGLTDILANEKRGLMVKKLEQDGTEIKPLYYIKEHLKTHSLCSCYSCRGVHSCRSLDWLNQHHRRYRNCIEQHNQ